MASDFSKTETLIPAGSFYAWLICGLAAFFYCYEYLLRISPSVMVNNLMWAFSLHASGVGLLAATYNYAYTPLQMIVGITLDYKGPRRVLTVCVALCGLGSLLFGLAHWLSVAVLGRLLIGVGSAFAYVGVLKLASIWLPSSRFAFFIGITNFLGMLGAMVGDIGLAHVVEWFGWRQLMWSAGIFGLLLVPLFWWIIRDQGSVEDHDYKLHSFQELVSQFLQIIRLKVLWLTGFVGGLYYLALVVFADLWGIPYLQQLTHLDKVHAAKLNAAVYLGWLVASPIVGWLSDFLKTRKKIMVIGGVGTFITFTLFILKTDWSLDSIYALLFLFGCFSTTEILAFAIAGESVQSQMTATALAFVNFLIMMIGMLLQPMVGFVLDWSRSFSMGYDLQNYQHAFWCLPLLFALGTFLACFLPETYKRSL